MSKNLAPVGICSKVTKSIFKLPCLAWSKENTVAPGMYRFLPFGSEKDCFLRETIASWNNWNMTHMKWRYCPIGICSLLMVSFAQMDNISGTFESLGLLIMATILGLCIQAFVVYPLIYFAFVRKNPYVYMKGVAQALLTAFGTSSSAATLPVTIHCVETKNKIDERISRFMLPIGATVNMDGGAFYESLAVIYLAQVYNYDLGFGRYLAISLAATLASIGTAGVPSVAPVAILIVIQAAGLPVESVSLIFAVDWILDRFRTTVNVCGDCFGAGVVEHLSKKDLENHLEDQKENYQRQQKKEEKTELMNCNSLHVSENGQIDCRNDETKL